MDHHPVEIAIARRQRYLSRTCGSRGYQRVLWNSEMLWKLERMHRQTQMETLVAGERIVQGLVFLLGTSLTGESLLQKAKGGVMEIFQ